MSQVIEDFINELKARINVLDTTDNLLDSSKVDQIESIIDKYGVLDTERYNIKDIEYIAYVLGISSDDKILTNYSKLDKVIDNFIKDFDNRRKTHIANKENEIAMYEKYIDLLTNNSNSLFGDYKELNTLMNNLGILPSDKWKIISYIDDKNIELKANELELINLKNKLSIYNTLYLDNAELNHEINKTVKDMDIDIDMIPSLSKKIAGNKYNINKTRNALTTVILNELYIGLKNNPDNTVIQEVIVGAFDYLDSYEIAIINPSKDIVVKYEDLLEEEINKGNINDYMNISLEDIEKLVNNHDKALKLKKLPIIKRIKDTLNSMNEINEESTEYISYLKLLMDLDEAYKELD